MQILRPLLPLALVASAAAADLHVDPGHPQADDAGPASVERPWRSLEPLAGAGLGAGDRLLLRRGATFDGGISLRALGEPGRPVVIAAYGEGERPLLRHTGLHLAGVSLEAGSAHVVVEGLAVRTAPDAPLLGAGVQVLGGSHHVVIRDNDLAEVDVGVKLMGDDNLVVANHIHDLRLGINTDGSATPEDHDDHDDAGALAVGLFNGRRNRVVGNRIERCIAPSFDFGHDGGAFEIYGNADGSRIHGNLVTGCNGVLEIGGGEGEWAGSARDVVLCHNLLVGNNALIVALHIDDRFGAEIEGLVMRHNTIVERADGRRGGAWRLFWADRQPKVGAFAFDHNVVVLEGYPALSTFDLERSYNLYHFLGRQTRLVAGRDASLGPGERVGDPLFVDPAAGDYRLAAGSPALDAGVAGAGAHDPAGAPVAAGTAVALGAFGAGP